MSTSRDALGRALQRVIGGRLTQSGLGQVWRDDRTWTELAVELVKTLSGTHVLVDRAVYDELVQDAARMRRVRQHVDEYHALTKKTRQVTPQNALAAWAAENMTPKKKDEGSR